METTLTYILLIEVLCCLFSSAHGKWEPAYVDPEYLDRLKITGEYTILSEIFGVDVKYIKPREGSFSAEELRYNKDLKFGDILPNPWETETPISTKRRLERQAINFRIHGGSRWRQYVPYAISNEFSADAKDRILKGIISFNEAVRSIEFYSRYKEDDYVYIINGNGCSSFLGRIGGAQMLSLGSGCVHNNIIHHEMMHALGISHEHDREDRDEFVDVLWNNIPEIWKPLYIKQGEPDFVKIEKYDYYSVLHYPYRAPETNKPAFIIKTPNINKNRLGHSDLSETDIKRVDILYQ